MASIGELFIELGVVGDPEQVEKFNKKIKETAKSMDLTVKSAVKTSNGLQDLEKGFRALTTALKTSAIIGAIKTLDTLTNSLVESNQAMLDLTRTTDIAQGTFQKWNNIGKMLGVENAAQQLEGLNQRMFELMLTGEGARGFQLAGINPVGQDANGVLEQLRDRVSGMDDTTATYLLQQMGLDPKMLHLLRLSRQEFEELGATVRKYQLTPEQTKQIQAMNVQLQIAAVKLQYLKDRAILAIMPAWTRFIASLARVTEGLQKTVQFASDFISKSPELQDALKGIAIAFGIIFAVAHPLLALLGALYLIIDDVVGYFQGKDSLVGEFLNYLDDFVQKFKEKFSELSFNKLIPEIILDVGEVIIKAGKVTLEKWHNNAIKDVFTESEISKFLRETNHPEAADVTNAVAKNNPFNTLKLLYALGYATKKAIEERHSEALKEKYGIATGGAASLIGYNGELPDISSMFVTPQMQRNISNSTVINNSPSYNQNITMNTQQPADDAKREFERMFGYTRQALSPGY